MGGGGEGVLKEEMEVEKGVRAGRIPPVLTGEGTEAQRQKTDCVSGISLCAGWHFLP